jgi:two-component system sensor histidine kinase QseC
MNSLRLRLLLLLSAALGIGWVAAAWFTHVEARHEIDEMFDAQLAQSAQVLLGTTHHELHESIERGSDEVVASHEYEQKLAFQIWAEGRLLVHSASASGVPFSNGEGGYSETQIDGKPWRVLTRWDKQHEFMIQVAEPLAAREKLVRHIALKVLLPTLVILPVLTVLIWLAVGAGLKPLNLLKKEVKQRTAERLEPVSMAGVPDEVVPLTQALNDLFARLQYAFEGERRFTADAAHELRTPLAALKTQAQVAMRATDDAERQTALENVLHGVDRATHLLEQLLTLARVDPEAAATGHEPIELRSLAASVLANLAPFAHGKQIELSLEDGPAGQLSGNPAQLIVLIRNLLDNAVRYTPEGGSVSVSIKQDQGSTVLEVCDTGPGIPEQEKAQVLERFYRIPGNVAEGSGLGLSIVQRIAELHHARLELANGVNGKGLRVSVVFA